MHNVCPYCGHAHDEHTTLLDETVKPRPGDISVCIECAGVLVFDNDLTLRRPSGDELKEALNDINVVRVVRAVQYGRSKLN